MITAEQLKTLTEIAERAHRAGVCPPDHRSADTTFAVMLAGFEMGFEAMQSIRLLQVVKGRVSPTADATVGLVARSPVCRFFRCAESTATQAVYETHREGHPEPARLVYTIQQAQRAGLTGSQTWKAHTEAMLRARCAAALARQVYPDLVSGIYSADEIAEIARDDDHAPAAPAPAPSPAVPDVDPDASRAYAAYVTAVEGAASCQAVAAAWMELIPALRLEGRDPAEWTADALGLAMRRVADLGVVGAKGALRAIATGEGDLPGIVDDLLSRAAADVPRWMVDRAAVLRTLPTPGPDVVRTVAARRFGGVATLDATATTAAGRALAEAVAALSAREPGDDDGDEPPPSAPQPPPQGRRARATATGPTGDAAPADGPAAWLGDDAAAEAHAAGWSHARHVEASVRRHGPTVSGDAYDRLVRVAAARLEAMSPADSYGTRPTLAGLHRTVSRWAAEGPVAARRAA